MRISDWSSDVCSSDLRRGTLPVTVENANPFPVDVVIRTTSDRLRFPDGGDLPVTVEAGDARRIDVPVEALATGSVPVSVALWTADGSIRLDGRQLHVRSTAISGRSAGRRVGKECVRTCRIGGSAAPSKKK